MPVTHHIRKRLVGFITAGFHLAFYRKTDPVSKAMSRPRQVRHWHPLSIYSWRRSTVTAEHEGRTDKGSKDQRFLKHEKTPQLNNVSYLWSFSLFFIEHYFSDKDRNYLFQKTWHSRTWQSSTKKALSPPFRWIFPGSAGRKSNKKASARRLEKQVK